MTEAAMVTTELFMEQDGSKGDDLMKRYWFFLFFGLFLWTTGWISIDWVLNYAVYHGMTELWLMQVPFTSIEIVTSAWQAYFLSFIQLHIALILIVESQRNSSKGRKADAS